MSLTHLYINLYILSIYCRALSRSKSSDHKNISHIAASITSAKALIFSAVAYSKLDSNSDRSNSILITRRGAAITAIEQLLDIAEDASHSVESAGSSRHARIYVPRVAQAGVEAALGLMLFVVAAGTGGHTTSQFEVSALCMTTIFCYFYSYLLPFYTILFFSSSFCSISYYLLSAIYHIL